MTVYDVELNALDGTPDVLANARGKVALVVNVASKCGLTPQYEQLEQLQRDYGGDGFTVLGVPCNQFLEQEPGSGGGDRHVLLHDLRSVVPAQREGRGEWRRAP